MDIGRAKYFFNLINNIEFHPMGIEYSW